MASILKVDTIQDQSGNNIINENADTITIGASGDTISVPTGATLTVPSGGLSGQNYPAFYARLDDSQTVTDNAVTKVTINEEYFDTDSCFDHTTNYRFTPTVAGKYCFYGQLWFDSGSATPANNLQQGNVYIYKNGASIAASRLDARATYTGRFNTKTTSFIASANGTSDYFELYGTVNNTSGTPSFYSSSLDVVGFTFFGAYRIGD